MNPALDVPVGCASAVIPARDEGRTIEGVLATLLEHELIGEVIVVDDGSTDDTAARAAAAGATVISLPENGGKAAAMSAGVAAASHPVVFFCDADVIGLTPAKVGRIVEPVLTGRFDMFVGIPGRGTYWMNRLLHFTPVLSGERALVKPLWHRVPRACRQGYQIEIALNYFAKHCGHRMGIAVLPGLSQVIKERKRGLLRGLGQRLAMIGDILLVSWRLYIVLQARHWARRLTRSGPPAAAGRRAQGRISPVPASRPHP